MEFRYTCYPKRMVLLWWTRKDQGSLFFSVVSHHICCSEITGLLIRWRTPLNGQQLFNFLIFLSIKLPNCHLNCIILQKNKCEMNNMFIKLSLRTFGCKGNELIILCMIKENFRKNPWTKIIFVLFLKIIK